jgi:histone-lysine N-methyltransferase SETMAR
MIPKQKDKAWSGTRQAPHETRNFDFKSQKNKVMLVTFFNSQGIIHKEFVPPGEKVNKEYYVAVLSRLVQRIYQDLSFRKEEAWFLSHDNVRPHTAASLKQFLAKQEIQGLNHPPYSPDVSPPDFFLFPKIKSTPKRRFEDTEDIKRNVTKELLALHADDFTKCFQQFYARAQKCVTSQGDYFEEYCGMYA